MRHALSQALWESGGAWASADETCSVVHLAALGGHAALLRTMCRCAFLVGLGLVRVHNGLCLSRVCICMMGRGERWREWVKGRGVGAEKGEGGLGREPWGKGVVGGPCAQGTAAGA